MVSKVLVIAVIAIVAIGGAAFFMFVGFPKPPATLVVDAGTVEVDMGDGYKAARSGMELKQGWSVRTGGDGKATIIFFDSTVTRLSENTEVTISELLASKANTTVSLDQSSGKTWNRVVKLSGIDTYEVGTPTGTATVRGTAFGVIVGAGESDVLVSEGTVSTSAGGEQAAISKDQQGSLTSQGVEVAPLEADAWVAANDAMDDAYIIELREELKQKHSLLLGIAKSRSPDVTDDVINDYLDRYLRGEYTIQDAINQGIIGEGDLGLIPEELKQTGAG
jgi:hypothetical protein